jgi:hypothetical protein
MNKIPDLLDFCITKGISPDFAVAYSCLDLSSDHSFILITLISSAIHHDPPPSLSNRRTDWDYFNHLIHHRLLQIPLKTPADVEAAVQLFTDTVQWAGWQATPTLPDRTRIHGCPIIIKQKLAEKRKLKTITRFLETPLSTGTPNPPHSTH